MRRLRRPPAALRCCTSSRGTATPRTLHPTSLKLHGFRCLGLDHAADQGLDITDEQVLSSLVLDITNHSFSAVVLNPTSEPYSIVRHLDTGPGRPAALYTTDYPDGVPADTLSPADALTLDRSQQILLSVVAILDTCHTAGVPFILGGPAPRHNPSFMDGALADPLGRGSYGTLLILKFRVKIRGQN